MPSFLHLVIYCLGCIAITFHDFMAAIERGNTQYRYSMHLYIKWDINCFAERMYSMRILRDSTFQTRNKTQELCMNFASRCKGCISWQRHNVSGSSREEMERAVVPGGLITGDAGKNKTFYATLLLMSPNYHLQRRGHLQVWDPRLSLA